MLERRTLIGGTAALWLTSAASAGKFGKGNAMYGLIGSITADTGKGKELGAYLLEGLRDMPGNLVYIVGRDPANADKLWITEVWDNAESHRNSLKLPQVQAAIAKARPIIAAMGDRQEFLPFGGVGLTGGEMK
jgi:quinol monooxygenase YgiN